MRKTFKAIMAGMVMAGALLTASPSASASSVEVKAHPTGCTFGIADAWRTWAMCKNSNGGSYRAIANCKDPETGKITTAEGNWQRGGGLSYAYCSGASRPSVAGFETRYN